MSLVSIKDVSKKFDKKTVLKDVNLDIPSGKIIGLLGKNGAGKTTLIKLINDLLTPDSGEILVNGNKIGVESKKVISYLPERTYLNKQMRVSEVLEYFSDFYDNFDVKKKNSLSFTFFDKNFLSFFCFDNSSFTFSQFCRAFFLSFINLLNFS